MVGVDFSHEAFTTSSVGFQRLSEPNEVKRLVACLYWTLRCVSSEVINANRLRHPDIQWECWDAGGSAFVMCQICF